MNKIIYVVIAYRFGDINLHSYIVGAYDSKEEAMKRAIEEEEFRGGKYACIVWKLEKNYTYCYDRPKSIKTDFFEKLRKESYYVKEPDDE